MRSALGGQREHRAEERGGLVRLAEIHGGGSGVHVGEGVVVVVRSSRRGGGARSTKRLGTFKRFKNWCTGLIAREPGLFIHWAWMRGF